ncbi:SulP family inorganic anion transporter [Bacillus sp. ISL-40]|uniref:SulP family inorganic anion transporter n=1 Tax=unclassified Bacillus (in: firmicutes) TaxID=185979 RepID=UPI001BEBFC5D|nr:MULTISPECIES: SulP family inorganic anion transporter [unclassified Bacillus (in: firmicutes)]MBT2696648.1 SulP family inorganic anion transporter [Bacillus sp. ISL-40]MBT2723771.1 SulP family inorganic anion transporter [Bacillus sp. ISL-46]MBT2739975.1 SulP family inorganic anion transporter [Bacillus sp. ISL-77]
MEQLSYKQSWFMNVKGDILSGIVVALALIPEAIAFSIIAGVDPMVGLYASFTIAVVISFVGGRPGMISAATGAMALVFTELIREHGLQYLLAATILCGVFQIIFGMFKLARYMKFIPRSVMVGFVNALAILIFMAQLQHFVGESWIIYVLVGATLAIIYLFPYITKAIPSTLVAIVAITALVIFMKINVRTVGDMGAITQTLPTFLIPQIPITWDTLVIILPYSLALAVVGLIESLLTASIVDDMTDSGSNKNAECKGQGMANIVAGFFGGMAGCAMIGQSVINVKSGGRGRLSTFIAGVFLMFLIVVLGKIVVQIPMATLAGVMIMVSISTFDWNSIRTLHILPRSDAIVMIVTVLSVVLTDNLAIGVIAGILLSAIFFVSKISKISVKSKKEGNKRTYFVNGELFFASVTELLTKFDYKENIKIVEINLSRSHVWDDSAVAAVDKIVSKFEENNIMVNVTGLNEDSTELVNKLANKLGTH